MVYACKDCKQQVLVSTVDMSSALMCYGCFKKAGFPEVDDGPLPTFDAATCLYERERKRKRQLAETERLERIQQRKKARIEERKTRLAKKVYFSLLDKLVYDAKDGVWFDAPTDLELNHNVAGEIKERYKELNLKVEHTSPDYFRLPGLRLLIQPKETEPVTQEKPNEPPQN